MTGRYCNECGMRNGHATGCPETGEGEPDDDEAGPEPEQHDAHLITRIDHVFTTMAENRGLTEHQFFYLMSESQAVRAEYMRLAYNE